MTEIVPPGIALVGGVSELFQSDLDLGRQAVERLQRAGLPAWVVVEDLHYGAVAVAQRLEELQPSTLVLVGAVRRGRAAGIVERRLANAPLLTPARVQEAVSEAVVGYVGVDLIVDVASGFGALPSRTVAIEVEPERVEFGEGLTALASAGLDHAVNLACAEALRSPLFELIARLRSRDRTAQQSPAHASLRVLLDALDAFDRGAGWGSSFALRDSLRSHMSAGRTSEGMDELDWGLWWALVEELDRLQKADASLPCNR